MTIKELKRLLNKHEEELGPETPVCVYSKNEYEDDWGQTSYIQTQTGIEKGITCIIICEE